MSDANLAALAYRPSGTGGFTAIRYTGESLKFNKETAQSQEIRDDGQIPDLAKVGGQPEGGFTFELSYAAQQWLLAAALRTSWVVFNISISATLTASSQTATAAAGTFDDVPVGALVKVGGSATAANNGLKRVVGKAADGSTLVFVAGSITADQGAATLTFAGKTIRNTQQKVQTDFEKRIVNSSGEDFFLRYEKMVNDTLELRIESKRIVTGSATFIGETYDIGSDGDDSGAVAPVFASGVLTFAGNPTADDTVTIGDNVYTFVAAADAEGEVTIGADAEESLDNLAAAIAGDDFNEAHPLVTAAKTTASTMTATAKIAGPEANTIATTEDGTNTSWGAATLAGGADGISGYAEAPAGDVMNGTNNMGTIRMNGSEATDRFKSITLNIANNIRGKDALSYEGNFDTGLGTIAVTGNLNAYFLNNDLPTKIKEHTSFSLEFYLEDAAGNRLYFYLPNVKPSNGDPTITAINTDVMIDTGFQAILDRNNGTGKTIFIDAVDAA